MYVNVKIRLAQFASHLGLSDAQFEKSISMPANTLRRLGSAVKSDVLTCAVIAYPQLNPDWLLTGSGPMLRSLREHPGVVNISPDGEDVAELGNVQANEPTQPYLASPMPKRQPRQQQADTITIPIVVWDQLRQQLENKDAQIATLLTKIQ